MPLAAIRAAHGPLLERASAVARARGLAIRTEQTYLHWVLRFIGFFKNRDPRALGATEVSAFLEYLAVHRQVCVFRRKWPPGLKESGHWF